MDKYKPFNKELRQRLNAHSKQVKEEDMLFDGVMVVKLGYDNSGFVEHEEGFLTATNVTKDKTYEEIKSFIDNGGMVFASFDYPYGRAIIPFVTIYTNGWMTFTASISEGTAFVQIPSDDTKAIVLRLYPKA